MPNIKEYVAPSRQLTPSTRGIQAYETAGRRIGPLYNAAAQDQREAGAVKGAMEKAKIWPFDIYALEASNAPRVTQSTTNENRVKVNDKVEAELTGGSITARGGWATGAAGADGFVAKADAWLQYARYTNELEDHPWTFEHGEASAGAVGVSRMARAAASQDGTVLRGSGKGVSDGVDPHFNPNSDLPVNWRDNPDYNGKNVIDTENGQFTPHQLDQFSKKYRDTWDRNMEKWNREQDRTNRQEQQYWNGPQGWNTRRNEWIDGKGGLNDTWQKGYDADMKNQAENRTHDYMRQHPDADRKSVMRNEADGLRYSPTSYLPRPAPYQRQDPGFWQSTVETLKDTFGRMFEGEKDGPEWKADIP